jgi:hypothetical protein
MDPVGRREANEALDELLGEQGLIRFDAEQEIREAIERPLPSWMRPRYEVRPLRWKERLGFRLRLARARLRRRIHRRLFPEEAAIVDSYENGDYR